MKEVIGTDGDKIEITKTSGASGVVIRADDGYDQVAINLSPDESAELVRFLIEAFDFSVIVSQVKKTVATVYRN